MLARMFLGELGGEHSSRLVLGGLLADLSAEHYSWVATGDKRNPDTTTVHSRAEAFLDRLHQLFTKGMILTLPDTYTGVTLKFLRETSYYRVGGGVQTVGIGDWEKEGNARNIIKEELARAQAIVANMKECMNVYRPEQSWIKDFHSDCLARWCRLYQRPPATGSRRLAPSRTAGGGFAERPRSQRSRRPANFCGRCRARRNTFATAPPPALLGAALRRSGPNSREPASS